MICIKVGRKGTAKGEKCKYSELFLMQVNLWIRAEKAFMVAN
jgi:hypothetical protein